MINLAWLVPVLPAIAFVIIIFLTRRLQMVSALTSILAMAGSFIISLGIVFEVLAGPVTMDNPVELSARWLEVPGSVFIQAGVLIDPLSAVMLFVVTFIALLVMIYSIGYMKGEPGYSTFFAYLSLFSCSMLGLVVSNNYFQIFMFWELVGLCSYLLIGFYYHKDSASQANKKAFITNRYGDFGFMLGMFFLFLLFGTFNFRELAAVIPSYTNEALLTVVALLIFVGPIAKSAQFPLHVWLPDAMEGPTPVSALIHAATMVAAGVYLLARGFVLFESATTALIIIALIGGFSSIFAASIGLVQRDIKRILAFSTMSQLGYMVMAIGLGSITAGMFHLTTHAFFKALLFLGAGSVIHAVHTQDIFEMGGLSKKMKVTTWTFIIGSLALAGIFPLAGFWSKDEILLTAANAGEYFGIPILGPIFLILGLSVAFMTAFYMFRLIFVTFFGEEQPGSHAHESPAVMTVPLIILSVFAIFSGFIGTPFTPNGFAEWVYYGEPHHPHPNYGIMIMSTVVALAGIWLAWLIYGKRAISAEMLANRFSTIHRILYNKYYIDEIYLWLFDRVMLGIADACRWCDRKIVDGIADGFGDGIRAMGARMRFIQTGNMQNYALVIFVAVVIIALVLAVPVLGGI
ncbi:MAG: NADH-quinone oxidoreductase subunit L [Clostridia bacterium]|nr:NADH-quinone oxidoreductase subunit L [Clostridia bacterium]